MRWLCWCVRGTSWQPLGCLRGQLPPTQEPSWLLVVQTRSKERATARAASQEPSWLLILAQTRWKTRAATQEPSWLLILAQTRFCIPSLSREQPALQGWRFSLYGNRRLLAPTSVSQWVSGSVIDSFILEMAIASPSFASLFSFYLATSSPAFLQEYQVSCLSVLPSR